MAAVADITRREVVAVSRFEVAVGTGSGAPYARPDNNGLTIGIAHLANYSVAVRFH